VTLRRSGPDGPPRADDEPMCRWLVYSGSPIRPEELLYKVDHSLIDQSMHAKLGATTLNGDGFGMGWYDGPRPPGLFRGIGPAWGDRNLRELSEHLESGLFFAHIRASTGTAVQETNCHPFRYRTWLWMHNGEIHDFHRIKRELALAIEPELFPHLEGSTDSELMFYLALSYGLRDDPPAAVARMVGHVERVAAEHGIPNPVQMTVATSNGEHVWIFRYSSQRESRSLFYSRRIEALRELYPDNANFRRLSEQTRIIVSEPLGDLPGAWREVPESTYGLVEAGRDFLREFHPDPV
jgi:glutamine amidotransferase